MLKRRTCNWAILIGTAAGTVVMTLGIHESSRIETLGKGWIAPILNKISRSEDLSGTRKALRPSDAAVESGRRGESPGHRESSDVAATILGGEASVGTDEAGLVRRRPNGPLKFADARKVHNRAGERFEGRVDVLPSAREKSGDSGGEEDSKPSTGQSLRAKPTADELYRAKFGSQAFSQMLLERHRQEAMAAGLLPYGPSGAPSTGVPEVDQPLISTVNPGRANSAHEESLAAYNGSPVVVPPVPPVPTNPEQGMGSPTGSVGFLGNSPSNPLWIHPAWVPLPATPTPPSIQVVWLDGRLSFGVVGKPLVGLQIQKCTHLNHSDWQTVYEFTEEKSIRWNETPGSPSAFWRLNRRD